MGSPSSAPAASPAVRAALVRLSVAHAARDRDSLREALLTAAEVAGPGPVEEVLLQAYLFLGFPATIWAFGIWRSLKASAGPSRDSLLEVTRDPAAADEEDAAADEEDAAADEEDPADPAGLAALWRESGETVCARVYGANYDKLRENVRELHPELDHWMILEGYGKVLSRPRLDLVTRELCIVALLAVTCWAPQLHSHLRGALNVGAGPEQVEEALEAGLGFATEAGWAAEARDLWARVRERHVR